MAPKLSKSKDSGGLKQGNLFSFFAKKPAAKAPPQSKPAPPPKQQTAPKEDPKPSVTVGTRISVYWKDDDEYYDAVVTQIDHPDVYHLLYEQDGSTECLDLQQETYKILPPRKKRRIQEEEEEASFQASLDDDEESAYEDKGAPKEDDDDDQWMITDDEDDKEIVSGKPSKKIRKTTKITKHAPSSQGSVKPATTTPRTKSTLQQQFGHAPQTVTPATRTPSSAHGVSTSSSTTTTNATSQSTIPTSNKTSSHKPPAFVVGALNPAGSHVHNHLPFLQNPRDRNGRSPTDPQYDPRTLKVVSSDWTRINNGKKMTDAVQQWWDLKSQYADTVLLFKTGKFYEMFHMDADIGVQVCGLSYMKGHVAHAGFPEIAYGGMADQLVTAGYKVARVEQTETPEMLKERKKKKGRGGGASTKVVNREVCSVMSLGTRTFCYLDQENSNKSTVDGSVPVGVGPLLAIREVLYDSTPPTDDDQLTPVCEFGITLVDATRGCLTIGQFADDCLRSRLTTLLTAFGPCEILLSESASPTLQSLVETVQKSSPHPMRLETVRDLESFPKSTALDPSVRSQLERGSQVHPWNVQETLTELHRRKYYPDGSKKVQNQRSVTRWPKVLRAAVEGNAELALSSFGAVLFYLQRNLIDAEILSMGIVKAYIPPASSAVVEETSTSQMTLQELVAEESREEASVDMAPPIVSPSQVPQSSVSDRSSANSSNQRDELTQAMAMQLEEHVNHMALDGTTLLNLEILNNSMDNKVEGSLWSKINYTKSPHGARLLRAWLLRPLFRKSDIERRADAVEELSSGAAAMALNEASDVLKKCGDIERLLSRVHSMSGSPDDEEGIHPNERAILYETAIYTKRKVGDFSKVLNGLKWATMIPDIFGELEIRSGMLRKLVCQIDKGGCFPDMVEQLDWFFANFDCDKAAKGLFEPSRGVDAAYDEACDAIDRIYRELEEYKNDMCSEVLKPRTLAQSSWKYANTNPESKDKYMIELPASIAVPDDFIMKGKRGSGHKQVNKYRTATVEALVTDLERALDVQKERKARGMQLIFAKFDSMRALWAAAAHATAALDALASMAHVASKAGYSRPTILDCPPSGSPSIKVTQGRHPCVEKTASTSEFVPNDLSLGATGQSARVLLLSGPNMGGKSTLLRQTCLIAILCQIGSFVPAESCEMTPVDRIYTRLGASDRILLGQSTFFVELAETAAALRGATRRSLVIMDELGRGTSTFDGTAIASAAVKHLVEENQCLCLFATHYHSLLEQWKENVNVRLGHMECVVEANDSDGGDDDDMGETNITFLYTLGEGTCPKSFGINVARLAGLPEQVLTKAKRISEEFEQEMKDESIDAHLISATNGLSLKDRVTKCVEEGNWTMLKAIWEEVRKTT